MIFLLHPALAQTRDYSRSNYTCTHILSYDTPVHTGNKLQLDIKHDMRQMRKERNILGFEVISGKHWGGVCDRDRDGGYVDVCV